MENEEVGPTIEEGTVPRPARQQRAPLLGLRATYARPLYAFRRDNVGAMVQALQVYMEPEEIEAERAEKARRKRKKEKEEETEPDQGNADASKKDTKAKVQYALDTWVFSLLLSIEGGEQGVRDLLAQRRSSTNNNSSAPLANISVIFKSSTTLDAQTLRPALLRAAIDAVDFGHLELAIQQAVAASRSRPLSEEEEVAAVMRCPYVLVNWIISFGTHTPDDYIKMCSNSYEPNWMHALVADIGRDFPEFNQHRKQCPLALNTESTLERQRDGASSPVSLVPIRGTPRCLYVTTYVAQSHPENSSPLHVMRAFRLAHDTHRLHPSLTAHRAVVTQLDAFMRPFRRAFLSKYAPGMTDFARHFNFSLPVNITTYYDVLCRFYWKVLHMQERKTDEVKLTQPFEAGGVLYDTVLSMPMLAVEDVDLESTGQPGAFAFHLAYTYIARDANGQPEEHTLLRQSTLSELVKSHYYGNSRREPLRL